MNPQDPPRWLRLLLAALLPLAAFILQRVFWPVLQPLAWFLFYPAVFFSAWLGGLPGALVATVLSVALVMVFFMSPTFSLAVADPKNLLSAGVFGVMGVLFGVTQQRVQQAHREALAALQTARSTNDQLETRLRERTQELARTAEQIQASEARYRSLFDNMLDGYAYCQIILDQGRPSDFRYVEVNDAFEALTGLKDVTGKKVSEVIPGVQASNPELFEIYGRVAVTGRPEKFETYLDGLGIWFSVAVYSPGPEHFVAVFDNITERKRVEAEINRLNADLEQRVVERTTQLAAANQELEAFAYSVSHDLRAPLRGIDGWSLALLEDYSDALDEPGRQYLGRVRSETQRMGHLIDDLLKMARVTRAEMRLAPVNLSALATNLSARLHEAEPARPAEFIIRADLTAVGDANLLEVLLENLLSNAFKFTRRRAPARIEFGQTELDGQPAFFVRDNGAGFDMAYAHRLFGAFQRLHNASDFPGTGIGLATVQRIVHRHGGRVWAEAEVERGATFFFTLEGAR